MKNTDKFDVLCNLLKSWRKVAVAYSGGVDSSFVLALALQILQNKPLALTVTAPYMALSETGAASLFCNENGIKQTLIQLPIVEEIRNNPVNRCYLCKRHVFTLLKEEATKQGFEFLIDGTNADDAGIYRPGMKALKELDIKSPLLEAGITKAEVRNFSEQMGLTTALKPSYACLLTRLPYDYEVKEEELHRIEKAEQFLASEGYARSRVRNHGLIARIELEKERIPEFINSSKSDLVKDYFRKIGYHYVTVDLEGYRCGSFDQFINQAS